MDDDATVIKFSDLICGKLVQRERNTIHPSKHQETTGEEPPLSSPAFALMAKLTKN
jgi:hypothetical protein